MRRLSTNILALISLFSVLAPAMAQVSKGEMTDLLRRANKGDFKAQSQLGNIYSWQSNYKESAKWYRRSAEHGYSYAQNVLGSLYFKGKGVPQDYKAAAKWYRKAAEQGYDIAQYNIGNMYKEGKGVPQDPIEAYKWYNLAAAQGGTAANHASKARKALAAKMNANQLKKAQELVTK